MLSDRVDEMCGQPLMFIKFAAVAKHGVFVLAAALSSETMRTG